MDTFDRVNASEEKTTEAVACAVRWAFAENPERPAWRQSREEVEKLLLDTKLDRQIRSAVDGTALSQANGAT